MLVVGAFAFDDVRRATPGAPLSAIDPSRHVLAGRLWVMQMSEPFAATVAAVAPVVWLVGAVEFHQVIKKVAEQPGVEREARLAEGLRAIRAEPDDALKYRLLVAIMTPLPRENQREVKVAYWGWALVTILLMAVEANALLWLGEDGGPGGESGKATALAWAMFVVLLAGFVMITLLPVVLSVRRQTSSHERWLVLFDELRAEVNSLEGRLRSSSPDSSEGEAEGVSPTP